MLALLALIPLVDSLLVDVPHVMSVGPQSCLYVPRKPHSVCVAAMNHMGMLVALNAEHYLGLGPLAPFANVPSERHCSVPHDHLVRPCPSLPLHKPGLLVGSIIDEECYLVDPASSHKLVSKIKSCMCKYELI